MGFMVIAKLLNRPNQNPLEDIMERPRPGEKVPAPVQAADRLTPRVSNQGPAQLVTLLTFLPGTASYRLRGWNGHVGEGGLYLAGEPIDIRQGFREFRSNVAHEPSLRHVRTGRKLEQAMEPGRSIRCLCLAIAWSLLAWRISGF